MSSCCRPATLPMPVDRYRVILTRAAVRDVIDLQTYLVEVMEAIFSLRDDPLRGHMLTGTLKGARALEFSLPGGAYRAAYRLEVTAKLCRVFAVGPHENFYQLAERRYATLKTP